MLMLWTESEVLILQAVAKGEKPDGVHGRHEHGRREMHSKLSDGKPAFERWDSWNVRVGGALLGEGSSERSAWDDARATALRALEKMK